MSSFETKRQVAGSGGGGGGGVDFGQPATGFTPDYIQYVDNSGNQYGDALFTRDSSTNLTDIARQVSADLLQGFQITDSLIGSLNFTGTYTNDSSSNRSAFVGVADLSSLMQSTTTAIVGAMDENGNFQTVTVAPNGVNAGYTNGVVDSTWTLSPSVARMRFDNGSGNEAELALNSSEAYLRYDDGINDYQIGADMNGFYWEYNGTKQRLPTAVAPSAGRVLTSTVSGSTWGLASSLPVAGGNTNNIQINGGSDLLAGYDTFTYDPATGVFATRRVSDAEVFALLDPSGNGAWRLGLGLSDGSAPYMSMSGTTRNFSVFGNRTIDDGTLVYTPVGGSTLLNDVSFSGTWDGLYGPATYTAVLDAVNNSYFTYSGLVGAGFVRGDTIEAYAGVTLLATGTVTGGSSGYPVGNALIANFGGVDVSTADNVIDTTNGSTATVTFNYLVDTLNWTVANSNGPANTTFGLPCNPTSYYTQGGLGLIAAAYTGHTVGDQWEQTFDFVYGELATFDGDNNVVTIGSTTFGNGTFVQIDDVSQLVTISNVPTYADDAAATGGGLVTGNLYKTTTGGITSLNIVP